MASPGRYVPAALVAALLVATAVAFVLTERLKLTPAPIRGPVEVSKLFSPACECGTDVATIGFVLRRSDILDVEIVDGRGTVVRELARSAPRRRGRVAFYWNGLGDDGTLALEGTYRPRVHLKRNRRTILMPNRIRLDVTPPRIALVSLKPRGISPDGDGRRDRVVAGYKVDEPAQVALYVDGVRRTLKKGSAQQGTIDWNGRIDEVPAEPGGYALTLGATDLAGNVGRPTRPVVVTLRYVTLGRRLIRARPGGVVSVRVQADARSVRWRLGNRTGTARTGRLRLRAPLQPGRYTLVVSAGDRSARAAVLVRRPRPAAARAPAGGA